jgi:hypothetical protein
MTIFNYKQLNSKVNSNKELFYSLIVFFILLVLAFYFQNRKSYFLKEHKTVTAIVSDKIFGVKLKNEIYVKFKINGKIIFSDEILNVKCFYDLKIGDKVLINYSLSNPQIAEIIDCDSN